MKPLLVAGLCFVSLQAEAQDVIQVPGSGIGTVSAYCYYLTHDECDAWIDATYNVSQGGGIPLNYGNPPPQPITPPPLLLTVSNLAMDSSYAPKQHACLVYSYTVPQGVSAATETRKLWTADWSTLLHEETSTVNLTSLENERCANFTTPDSVGSSRAQVCLSAGGATECSSETFMVNASSDDGGESDRLNVNINWWNIFKTVDGSWSTPASFATNETFAVMFGGTNDSTSIGTFDVYLKFYDSAGNMIGTNTGNISMPEGGSVDSNGDNPRFTTSFPTAGTYNVEICIGDACSTTKSITITGSGSGNGSNLPDVSVIWWNIFKTSDNSWSTPGTFNANESFAVMFGGTNNSSTLATFDADLKVYDPAGNYITTKSGSITMPVGGSVDQNSENPRYFTDFTMTGIYNVQLCVGEACGSQKTITIQ